ncbi:MAG: hypothetical protein ACHQ1H_06845, partial [Nitrososphaerales archaeon]
MKVDILKKKSVKSIARTIAEIINRFGIVNANVPSTPARKMAIKGTNMRLAICVAPLTSLTRDEIIVASSMLI